MSILRRTSVLLLLSVAACTTVGPDYTAPATSVADGWLETSASGPIDPQWWDHFGDPMLVELIEAGVRNSPDIAETSARLREARANRDAAQGRRLPEVNAAGSATQNRISENGQLPGADFPGFDPTFSLFDVGFDANWEIDFWGRQVRTVEAATARSQAAEEARRAVIVSLTGEIARNYIDLRAAQADIASAEQMAASNGNIAQLTDLRARAGESSPMESREARARASASEQAVPAARARAADAAYRIAILVGAAPETVVPGLLTEAPIPQAPESILVGIRSDLLARRPDVRQAERELAAATADIGVATADLFPRFSLFGAIGQQARSLDDLPSGSSLRYSIGPSISWPIFSGDRIRAHIRAADARADAAAARYEKAVLTALNDSESAVNSFLNASRTHHAAIAEVEQQSRAFTHYQSRFTAGEDNRIELETARQRLIAAQERLATTRAQESRAAAILYKELGGAWTAIDTDGALESPYQTEHRGD
jgi:outer membrane protein, multidrug efflux system